MNLFIIHSVFNIFICFLIGDVDDGTVCYFRGYLEIYQLSFQSIEEHHVSSESAITIMVVAVTRMLRKFLINSVEVGGQNFRKPSKNSDSRTAAGMIPNTFNDFFAFLICGISGTIPILEEFMDKPNPINILIC